MTAAAPNLRRARRRDARLVPVAAAAWGAAAFAVVHPAVAGWTALALWAGAGGALLVALFARGAGRTGGAHRTGGAYRTGGAGRTWSALLAVGLAAGAAVCTHVTLAEPPRAAVRAIEIDGGRSLTLDLIAVGKIERSAGGWRFDAALTRARLGTSARQAHEFGAGVAVLVRLADAPPQLDLGSRLRVTATAWPADAGERAVLVVDATGEPEILAPPPGALGAASALRHGLRTATSALPQPGGGLIAGLAVGDTSGVDAGLDAAMKASSLSHLTAVSGANCALVVALAYGAAALCRARRGVRVAAGMTALAAFVVLVSPEPSVVRAATMAAIAMLGVLLGRPGAGLSLLTTAVIVLLIADPWLGLSLGFALSAAATGALLVGAGPLADGLARWMPRPLALAIAVPLAAQLACGPLIVLIAPQVSVFGVVANLLAAPAAPLGTVIGLVACLTAGIPLLGAGVAALAWLPAAWIAGTATTFAALPGSVIAWPEGPWGVIALAAVGAATAAVIAPTPARVRVCATLVLAGAVGIGVALGPVADGIAAAGTPQGWAIAACDVGQGDAVLVRSDGHVALIDTGPDPAPLSRCLGRLGIDRIDLLVLTHFDLDHRGGVDAVRGRVGTVLHGPPADAQDQAVLSRLEAAGARLTSTVRGMAGPLGAARWRALWPRAQTTPGNDASVVIEVTGGGVPTSLFLGDLSQAGQQALSAGAVLLSRYEVVKVAHHGSADQDAALYERLHPALAVISVGVDNDYGHPRSATIDLLSRRGARIARTDQEGLVAVWRDDAGLRLWHERAAVAPGG